MSKSSRPPFGVSPASASASVSSTPAPPSLSETLSIATLPRPFKQADFTARMARISSNLSRRNKSLKQILQAERDAALRASGIKVKGGGGAGAGGSKRNAAATAAAAAAREAKLVGAAKRAWAKRTERERREREARGEVDAVVVEESKEDTPVAPDEGGEEEKVKDEEGEGKGQQQNEEEVKEEEEEAKKPKRDVPTYSSVEAPPSLRPQKKYCDVTGLTAPYTDPKTRLRYHSVQVYEIIKQFGPGVDNAYLALRGDNTEIK